MEYGMFDVLTDREDGIVNRLAFLRHRIEALEPEVKEIQQDIRMWQDKRMKKKDNLKRLMVFLGILVALCIIGFLFGHLVVIMPSYFLIRTTVVIGRFLRVVSTDVLIPLIVITMPILLFFTLHFYVVCTEAKLAVSIAKIFGIKNLSALIQQARPKEAELCKELEKLKAEKQVLEVELESIKEKTSKN